MATTIKTVGTYMGFAGPGVTVRRFRIQSEKGYCEFAVTDGSRMVMTFGGSLWPDSFPEVFQHFGPDAGQLTARSGYELTDAGAARIARLDQAATADQPAV